MVEGDAAWRQVGQGNVRGFSRVRPLVQTNRGGNRGHRVGVRGSYRSDWSHRGLRCRDGRDVFVLLGVRGGGRVLVRRGRAQDGGATTVPHRVPVDMDRDLHRHGARICIMRTSDLDGAGCAGLAEKNRGGAVGLPGHVIFRLSVVAAGIARAGESSSEFGCFKMSRPSREIYWWDSHRGHRRLLMRMKGASYSPPRRGT